MKKFKLTWDERVRNDEGDTLHFESKIQIIEAENADAACAQWEQENEHNEDVNGLEDCVEVVDHPLLSKHMMINMPDGLIYGVSIETIARHRAEYYAGKDFDGDNTKSLVEDTLPLFESDESEIRDWASNNMNWSDVERHSIVLKKNVSKEEFQEAWVNGEYKIA